jgi:hypothetical protein
MAGQKVQWRELKRKRGRKFKGDFLCRVDKGGEINAAYDCGT